MRGEQTRQIGTQRHDLGRIDVGVDDVVVLLDLDEVDGVTEARGLEEIA